MSSRDGWSRSSPVRPTTSPTCLSGWTPTGFYGDCARALRTIPRGEVVTYGELAALAGHPGAARAAGTFCARCELAPFLPVPPGRVGERHRQLRLARRRVQAAAAGARACRSLTTSATSSRRSPRRGAAAAWPSCPRSSTPREPGTCAAGRVAVHLDLVELGDRAPRVRAPARSRRAVRDPHLLAPVVRPRDAVPAARRRRRSRARGAARGRRALPVGRTARQAAEARRRPLVLPRRLPARRAARRRLAVRPARSRTSSCARSGIEGARFIADVAAGEDVQLKVAERRTHAVAYAKGHEAIADLLALAGAGDTALRLEEHAVLAAPRADANRLANADEANLVRSARAAQQQVEAINAVGARRAAAGARRDRRAAPAAPVRLAARARGQGASADHEGDRPPPPARDHAARRKLMLSDLQCSSETSAQVRILKPWRARARPTVDTDPVHRHRSIPANRREGSSSEPSLRPARSARRLLRRRPGRLI